MRPSPETIAPDALAEMQQGCLAELPRIQRVIRFRLRHITEERREDAIEEAIALSWKAYRTLFLKGRNVGPLVQKIAESSARRVRYGRGLTNMNPLRDVMSDTSRHRHDYSIGSIHPSDDGEVDPDVIDALQDRGPSPADEATLNVDYEEWLEVQEDRRRWVAEQLEQDFTTTEVARELGVTRTRVWQLREDLKASWNTIHGKTPSS